MSSRHPWHTPICTQPHPAYPEITCSQGQGHPGAHSGLDRQSHYATWGFGVLNVVSLVDHHGEKYVMLDDGHFGCCFVDDRPGRLTGQIDWHFQLWGLHAGPTLDVWLCNVRLAYDDDGPGTSATWDTIEWADDHTKIEDAAMLDGYTDALVPEVKEMLQEK